MIDALFRITAFLLVFLLILAIRQTTVRHRPTRRTNVPRSDSETCVWLQRFVDGLFDVFVLTFAPQVCRQLQDKITAFLEDRGFAVKADFVVQNVGTSPPRVVALRVVHLPIAPQASSAQQSCSSIQPAGDASATSSPPLPPISPTGVATISSLSASLPFGMGCGQIEADLEVEYSGGAVFQLNAEVPVVRGRSLPLSITLSDVQVRCHCKVILTPRDTIASMHDHHHAVGDAFQVDVKLTAVSEPDFSFQLHTRVTKYRIENFFGFAMAAKAILLRVVRKELMHGVAVKVPLPAEWSRGAPKWFRDLGGLATAGIHGGRDGLMNPHHQMDGGVSEMSSFVHPMASMPLP